MHYVFNGIQSFSFIHFFFLPFFLALTFMEKYQQNLYRYWTTWPRNTKIEKKNIENIYINSIKSIQRTYAEFCIDGNNAFLFIGACVCVWLTLETTNLENIQIRRWSSTSKKWHESTSCDYGEKRRRKKLRRNTQNTAVNCVKSVKNTKIQIEKERKEKLKFI